MAQDTPGSIMCRKSSPGQRLKNEYTLRLLSTPNYFRSKIYFCVLHTSKHKHRMKRGLPRKCARFVLFRPVKKRSFNLLCDLEQRERLELYCEKRITNIRLISEGLPMSKLELLSEGVPEGKLRFISTVKACPKARLSFISEGMPKNKLRFVSEGMP